MSGSVAVNNLRLQQNWLPYLVDTKASYLVRRGGLEPPRRYPLAPQACMVSFWYHLSGPDFSFFETFSVLLVLELSA